MVTRSSSCRTLARVAALALACAGDHAVAQPQSSNAQADAGKALHDKDCVACHARQFSGDASKMYTRSDHRVRTPAQLHAQIAYCNTQLGTQYFPEDEDKIFAYLNREYYRFKP